MAPPRARTILIVLAVAFAVGAATTVAVAWTLAALPVPDAGVRCDQRIHPERGRVEDWLGSGPAGGIGITLYRNFGRLVIESRCYGVEFREELSNLFNDGAAPSTVPPDDVVPSSLKARAFPWLAPVPTPWPTATTMSARLIEASGWPMLALASERIRDENTPLALRGGIECGSFRRVGAAKPQRQGRGSTPVTLPLLPLWLGFAANTLLFTACWLSLLIGAFWIRSSLRTRAGRCARCRYDLRGLQAPQCPECGTPTPPALRASAPSPR